MSRCADTTVVITSCNRHHLLKTTIESFIRFNSYDGIKEMIIIEDGGVSPESVLEGISFPFPIKLIINGLHMGQVFSIDRAYSHVESKYIFHCEDDWEFYAEGFVEESRAILERYSNVFQTHLRKIDSKNYFLDAIMPYKNEKFALYQPHDIWFGFSCNPGLRRLCDYRRIGNYSTLLASPFFSGHFEAYLGQIYKRLGYEFAVLLSNNADGYVRHLGDKQSTYWTSIE